MLVIKTLIAVGILLTCNAMMQEDKERRSWKRRRKKRIKIKRRKSRIREEGIKEEERIS